jgi:hypothetical protein
VKLFEHVTEKTGEAPPVIDAKDVLTNPAGMLTALCGRLGLPFCDEMLSWPPGPRDTDGAWAPHWYSKVYKTTTFGPYQPNDGHVPAHLSSVLNKCEKLYQQLYDYRLRPVVEHSAVAKAASNLRG